LRDAYAQKKSTHPYSPRRSDASAGITPSMRKGNGLAARRASLGKTTTPSHAVATCTTMNQKIVFSRRSRPRSAIVRYAVRTTSSDTTMLTAWNAVSNG
jgi:hypothetical protein